ncbi:hypothetical protein BB560_006884 [Smittium megazygosporum]|uniref:Uncharacterized protein n=1 Tax=Smittium megazygosporum TaxID=133381 RepID=A0A2T9Y0G7_9FUNG|nr:hypothetical protein BB560_006884 [Smittium megazygosporum]
MSSKYSGILHSCSTKDQYDGTWILVSFNLVQFIEFFAITIICGPLIYRLFASAFNLERHYFSPIGYYSLYTRNLTFSFILFVLGNYSNTFNYITIVSYVVGLAGYTLLVELPFLQVSFPTWKSWPRYTLFVIITAICAIVAAAAWFIKLAADDGFVGVYLGFFVFATSFIWIPMIMNKYNSYIIKTYPEAHPYSRLPRKLVFLIKKKLFFKNRECDKEYNYPGDNFLSLDPINNSNFCFKSPFRHKKKKHFGLYKAQTEHHLPIYTNTTDFDNEEDIGINVRNKNYTFEISPKPVEDSNHRNFSETQGSGTLYTNYPTKDRAFSLGALEENTSYEFNHRYFLSRKASKFSDQFTANSNGNSWKSNHRNYGEINIFDFPNAFKPKYLGLPDENFFGRALAYVHVHHYQIFYILAFFTRFSTVFSRICAGLVLGIYTHGIAAYGFDRIFLPKR